MRRLAGALLVVLAAGLGGAVAQTQSAHVYGSTEDLRFMSVVEAKLEAEMQSLQAPRHLNATRRSAATIEFVVGDGGRIVASRVVSSSSDRVLNDFAVHALAAAAPFPVPPPLIRGKRLVWTATRDSDGSSLRFK